MNTLDHLASTLLALLLGFFALILGVFDAIEGAVADALLRAGVPPSMQTGIFIVVAILFVVVAVRVFGGLIRAGLILLLILLLVHALAGSHRGGIQHVRNEAAPSSL